MLSSHFTQDGICHVPILGASYRQALNPYAHPSSVDDLTTFIFNQLVAVTGFEPVLLVSKTRMLTITPYRYFVEPTRFERVPYALQAYAQYQLRHGSIFVDTGGIRTPPSQCKCEVLANYTTRPIVGAGGFEPSYPEPIRHY